MLLSIVYFPKFCGTSPMRCQRHDVSRHVAVKVEAMHLPSRGQTLLVLASGKGAKCQFVKGVTRITKSSVNPLISVEMRLWRRTCMQNMQTPHGEAPDPDLNP